MPVVAIQQDTIDQAIADFGAIKQAVIQKGVDVPSGTPTSQYPSLINSISGGSTVQYAEGTLARDDVLALPIANFNRYEINGSPYTLPEPMPYIRVDKLDFKPTRIELHCSPTIYGMVITIPMAVYDGLYAIGDPAIPVLRDCLYGPQYGVLEQYIYEMSEDYLAPEDIGMAGIFRGGFVVPCFDISGDQPTLQIGSVTWRAWG